MCRAQGHTGQRTTLRCDCTPSGSENRRNRQNLSNAVNRAVTEDSVTMQESEQMPLNESMRPAKSMAEILFPMVDTNPNNPDASKLEQQSAELERACFESKEDYVAMMGRFQEERHSYDSDEAWILAGNEDTPESFQKALSLRTGQMCLAGRMVDARAAAIHGYDVEAERLRFRELEEASKKTMEAKKRPYEVAKQELKTYSEALGLPDGVAEIRRTESFASGLTDEQVSTFNRLHGEKEKTFRTYDDARIDYSNYIDGTHPEVQKMNAQIAQATLQAVTEVREFDGNLEVVLRSRSKEYFQGAQNTIEKTIPKDWIDKSNAHGALEFHTTTDTEGHYSDSKKVDNGKPPFAHMLASPPDLNDPRFADWQAYTDTATGRTLWRGMIRDTLIASNASNPLSKDFKANGEPKGTGWKRVSRVKNRNGDFVPGWMRDNPGALKAHKKLSEGKPGAISLNESLHESVSTHEFIHRVEEVHPVIAQLETSWVTSRTTNPDGTRQKMTLNMIGNQIARDEFVRADDFVEPYMGRDYRDQGSHHEVMSMASEALFHGKYGGLQGLGHERKDVGTRNFALGVFVLA